MMPHRTAQKLGRSHAQLNDVIQNNLQRICIPLGKMSGPERGTAVKSKNTARNTTRWHAVNPSTTQRFWQSPARKGGKQYTAQG